MKFFRITVISAMILIILGACSQSKWSKEDEEKWMKNCRETFVDQSVNEEEKAQLEDLCDCMLKLTSRKYTVQEAQNLTEEQERSLLNDCNYSY
jgi:thiamine biosynthesis lipoprotein ApbE